METMYWFFEYGKVFCGYLFLMFLWPSVVFYGHLKKKTKTYRFSFCVTVQIVIINTIVLTLGLFHILNQMTVILIFYGVFVFMLLKRIRYSYVPGEKWHKSRKKLWESRRGIQAWLWEYGLLVVVLAFGMIYFSYGAFQVHSYGWGDLYVHHEWIYGLIQGNIFSGGVYPEAMHCFIYTMSMLFHIRVYSILLFLQGIHVVVLLLSAYLLLREVFHWRYTPVFVLMLFLTLDVVSAEQIYSMFRLQITLPMEFGLHTQFLCVLYLMHYLNKRSHVTQRGKTSKYYWDENLFLFMMSLTASIAIHFYTVIMAFVLCGSFAIFAMKRIFNRKYLIPLVLTVAGGCVIAFMPMTGALVSGIPFNYSIDWALKAADGEEARQLQEEIEKAQETVEKEQEPAKKTEASPFIKRLPSIYKDGYLALYGQGRARWILGLTIISIVLCLIGKSKSYQWLNGICYRYPPLVLFSFLFMLLYAAPYAGYPELISDSRFCSVGHLMILAVTAMPVDVVFSLLMRFFNDSILKLVSVFTAMGIYVGTLFLGNYRGFLFYELTRYNSTVEVTNSIIDQFPSKSYTIVAPTDELYPIILYGWHEELQLFAENCTGENYTLPSEYVFIYVEKKPLLYAQAHFFEGPTWMGEEKYSEVYWKTYSKKYPDSGVSQAPEIKTAEISTSGVQNSETASVGGWYSYTRLKERTTLESKVYEWCQRFSEIYPETLDIYYEDEDFVCYYFRQDTENLYNLGIGAYAKS